MAFQSDIKKALQTQLEAYRTAYPIDIAYEGSDYDPTEGVLYLSPFFLPAAVVQQELLGSASKDRFTGIYQINIVYKKGSGVGDIDSIANVLQGYFGKGTGLPYVTDNAEDILVELNRFYTGNLNDNSAPWMFVPLFIEWRSDIWVGVPV